MNSKPIRSVASLAFSMVTVGMLGCGGAPMNADNEAIDSASAQAAGPHATTAFGTTGQMLTVPDPNGVYFANISANGTGCPAGTWTANIDPSGQTFTVTFSQYEVSISPGQMLGVKDCQLGIDLHSPQGLSFSVAALYYSGYAFLDSPGMSARQTANYYFQGNPIEAEKGRTNLNGPTDQEYTFQDNVPIADLVWSQCGTQRLLNVSTRIFAFNNHQKSGTGYVNTLAVDGQFTLTLHLSWRTCPAH